MQICLFEIQKKLQGMQGKLVFRVTSHGMLGGCGVVMVMIVVCRREKARIE
jgi:hypothetical protein